LIRKHILFDTKEIKNIVLGCVLNKFIETISII
jgi:hypothetical protein